MTGYLLKDRIVVWVFFLCCFFVFGGCDSPDSATSPASEIETSVDRDSRASNNASGSLRIEPPTPQSNQSLMLKGVGLSTDTPVRWFVNGDVVLGQQGHRLSEDYYQANDQVEARVVMDDETLTATALIANSPPEITTVLIQNDQLGTAIDIVAAPQAHDADNDYVNYRYRWLINGKSIEGLDEPVLYHRFFQKGDEVSLQVTPLDGTDEGATFYGRPLVVPNSAPVINSTPPSQLEGDAFSYQLSATDPDGDTVTYHLVVAPSGMTIDAATGLLRWPAELLRSGQYDVTVAASDDEGAETSQRFQLNLERPER